MRNRFVQAVLAAALITALPLSAAADRRGGRDDRSSAGFSVSRADAESTARAEGLVEIYETKARRGVWKFEGLDAQGRKLEISVDGVTGDVVKRETYGTGSRRSRSGSDS
jgi:Peptidase propeptide and YPEB domain